MGQALEALKEALRARFPMHVVEAPASRMPGSAHALEYAPAGEPEAAPAPSGGWSTGVAALDRALGARWCAQPGAVAALVGERSSGRTALLCALCAHRVAQGEVVALVDATRTLPAAVLARIEQRRAVVIRPARDAEALWAADQLLRVGAFRLVVVVGGPAPGEVVLRRIAGLARAAAAKVLLLPEEGRQGAAGRAGCALVHVGARGTLDLAPALEFEDEDRLPAGTRIPDRRPRA
ncbi:MAG TPA: hypothetical protein VG389_00040 [Myxococcota bacterium]|jgi:hypothetical protein|nr:hypothetical protein [Myxococcota bacterium]